MQTFEDLDTVTDRANAGLQTLAAQPEVNSEKLAAVGFAMVAKWYSI